MLEGNSITETVLEYPFSVYKFNPDSFIAFLTASPILLCLSNIFLSSKILSIAVLNPIISLIGGVYGNHLSL